MNSDREKMPLTIKIRAILQALKWKGKKITFVEEDGVYKATIGKRVWYIPSKDRKQCTWALDFMDSHERFLDILQEGDIVIEAGAASGEYTIPAAKKVGDKGQIHAFEIEPASYLCLEKNLSAYNISNVKPVKKAISDELNKE